MTKFFSYSIGFFIIILQTSVIPYFFYSFHFFDISIPFILYLSLRHPFTEGLFVVIFLGFFTDSFSSGPFGIYETTYLWFFICTRWAARFFHTDTYLLLSIIIFSGILLENIIFFGTSLMLGQKIVFLMPSLYIILWQLCLAAVTGPLIFYVIDALQTVFEYRVKEIFEKWKQVSE